MDIPILLMAFIRPDLLQQCLHHLSKFKPPILYIAIDGPRSEKEQILVKRCREIALKPSWKCNVIPLFQDKNLGMIPSFVNAMNKMFSEHDYGIFLEDDVLLSESFYPFAQELLLKYKNNPRVGHINASNFIANNHQIDYDYSYVFSSHTHVWGFATWKRMWNTYDLSMVAWKKSNQNKLLNQHCFSRREKRGLKRLFDLHCENPDPWACDYQWQFNCLHNKALAITPEKNMSLNIGFDRIDSTHTKWKSPHNTVLETCSFPLSHPRNIDRQTDYDKKLSDHLSPSDTAVITGKIKNKLRRLLID